MTPITRRAFSGAGGALVVGLGLGARAPRRAVAGRRRAPGWPADRFLGKPSPRTRSTPSSPSTPMAPSRVFTGKVDLGTGGRVAMRQMVAEELEVSIERITD